MITAARRSIRTGTVILTLIAASVLLGMPPIARAASTDYPARTAFFIDNSAGCDDSVAKPTKATPWCDFTNVDGHTFAPGDQILLRSGDTFTQGLAPLGSGSAQDPITVGCYPSSSCAASPPVIKPDGVTDPIDLTDPSYWTVSGLDLTGGGHAVHVHFTTLGHQGLRFDHLQISDPAGDGIEVDGFNDNPQDSIPAGQWIIKNFTVDHVTISGPGGNGIEFIADYPLAQLVSPGFPNAQQDITLSNVDVRGTSSAGINIIDASHVKVADSTMIDDQVAGLSGTASYDTSDTDVAWVNDLFENNPFTNGNDNAVFVYDNHVNAMTWSGDYFAGNSASGIEVSENPCGLGCTTSTNTHLKMTANTFTGNSASDVCGPFDSSPDGYWGDIDFYVGPFTQATVSDNLYDDTQQTCNGFVRGPDLGPGPNTNVTNQSFNNVTLGAGVNANLSIVHSTDISNAGDEFSGPQTASPWTYQSNAARGGNAFASMIFSGGVWRDRAGGTISQFDLTPAKPGRTVERVWSAPRSGIVQVRGWALSSVAGGRAQATIRTGHTVLWHSTIGTPPRQAGVASDVHNLRVRAGEQIAFQVTGDSTSWIPTVAYSS